MAKETVTRQARETAELEADEAAVEAELATEAETSVAPRKEPRLRVRDARPASSNSISEMRQLLTERLRARDVTAAERTEITDKLMKLVELEAQVLSNDDAVAMRRAEARRQELEAEQKRASARIALERDEADARQHIAFVRYQTAVRYALGAALVVFGGLLVWRGDPSGNYSLGAGLTLVAISRGLKLPSLPGKKASQ